MRLKGGLPLAIFVVLLIAIPMLEIWLIIQVGQLIGGWLTLAILIAEALLGAWLLKREGGKAWQALQEAFGTGRVPSGEMTNAALVLVGGLLLMLPGFATDVIGFFFLLPWTRPWARRMVGFFVARRAHQMGLNDAGLRAKLHPEDVIKGETVETSPPNRRPRPEDEVISGEIE